MIIPHKHDTWCIILPPPKHDTWQMFPDGKKV